MPTPPADNVHDSFAKLLTLIKTKVRGGKASGAYAPETLMYRRMKTLDPEFTATGVYQRKATEELIPRNWWVKATIAVFNEVQASPEYAAFKSALDAAAKGGPGVSFDYAVQIVIGREFNDEATEPNHVELLLRSARGEAIPAWVDTHVFGVALNTKAIALTFGANRILLRQVALADYEKEHPVSLRPLGNLFDSNPSAILRVELDVTSSSDFSEIERTLLTLFRLVHVWPVSFGERSHGAHSPFPFVGRGMLGGTSIERGFPTAPPVEMLTEASAGALQSFVDAVGPRIGSLTGPQADTALAIAFDRYAEALFAYPIERRIAACIMGMEALFFRKTEIQELGYRLGLRVAKQLSKAGFNGETVRDQVQRAYGVRSRYVHGSHLSAESRKEFEKDVGLGLHEAAQLLLDYLRIGIVHFVLSRQSKTDFLNLVEASFLDHVKDAELTALIGAERAVLRPDLALARL